MNTDRRRQTAMPPTERGNRFDDRTVIVTGGSSGIGLQTAAQFFAEGATVEIVDLQSPPDADVAACGLDLGDPRLVVNHVDVTDEQAVTTLVADVIARRGGIDIVVNNAIRQPATGLQNMSLADWSNDVGIALTAPFLMTQQVLPALMERGGAIVNVGSINAVRSLGCEAYSAAKAGLASLTRSVAAEFGPAGVRANIVLPGTISTPVWAARFDDDPQLPVKLGAQYPLRRIGTVADIANAICFLASDEAAWISGTELVVDGGYLASGGVLGSQLDPDD